MEIELTLEIPEAKTRAKCRELARLILSCGKAYSLVDFDIKNFNIRGGRK